jgi:hypothetical protein
VDAKNALAFFAPAAFLALTAFFREADAKIAHAQPLFAALALQRARASASR